MEEPTAMISLSGAGGATGWIYGFASGQVKVHVQYSEVPGPWIYHVEGRILEGRVAVTSLAIAPRDPEAPTPITKDTVRRTPVGSVLARVKTALLAEWEEQRARAEGKDAPEGSGLVARVGTDAITHTVKRGRSWPAEHFMQVAWFYVIAELTDEAPRKMIAQHWGVSEATASRWLDKARKLDYLPNYPAAPTRPRTDAAANHEANRDVERQIFEKVLWSGLGRLGTRAERKAEVDDIVQQVVLGDSPEAQRIRATIFSEQIVDLAERYPNESVRQAANDLLEALANSTDPDQGED
ncbi:hypothetical protein [Streptomyces ardesiacus]|uniref:Uncharacterized protein n=1 Tax=Streptomyces ardesiacus TaxID=285564 RepID=A0ABW8HFS7_9ACTN